MIHIGDINSHNIDSVKADDIMMPSVDRTEISKSEANDYWDNMFLQPDDEVFEKYFEEMFFKVFELHEEDFDFSDIKIDDELKALLKRFDSEKWSEMSNDEKKNCICDLVTRISDLLGMEEAPGLSFFDEESDIYGFFDPVSECINLNTHYLDDSKEVVNTVVHETRHAYQHERAGIQENEKDNLYRFNFENYISADQDYFLYSEQIVEVEARAFASIFSEEVK